MNSKELFYLFARYFVLIAIGLFGTSIIYSVFTPLTIYPVFWVLNLFYSVSLENSTLFINNLSINIIPACIAGAAYYLLLILNLSTPLELRTRAKSLAFIISSFLILNIIRIVIFAALFIQGFSYFDFAHKLTWYFGSTILVAVIWFMNVFILKIKSIPACTDLKNLFNMVMNKGKRKR